MSADAHFAPGQQLFVTNNTGSMFLGWLRAQTNCQSPVMACERGTATDPAFLRANPMSWRIRHCVECPRCLTRYVIGFSPYGNQSYLVPNVGGASEEFTLYCSCGGPSVTSRWTWGDVKTCAVSKVAYRRGYGTPEEVSTMRPVRAEFVEENEQDQ